MSDDFREDWIFETIAGQEPGSISINKSTYTRNGEYNGENNPSSLIISDLLPLNLALAFLVIIIIIWKKRKNS